MTPHISERITNALMMGLRLRHPSKRTCECCGRSERWATEGWQVNGSLGDPYCIHEWDINGSFVPFERE